MGGEQDREQQKGAAPRPTPNSANPQPSAWISRRCLFTLASISSTRWSTPANTGNTSSSSSAISSSP